jgi:uncharacterized protein
MEQTWRDLLFAHWRVDPAYLRPMVPAQLELDVFDGSCWVAVTPFWLTGVRGRELNVRTYVRCGGAPGVFFFSLDATNIPAIIGARMGYGLPYFFARMWVDVVKGEVAYYCRRVDVERARAQFHGNANPDPAMLAADGVFRGRYWPTSEVWRSTPGSLEHFLTERYCLYAVVRGRVFRADIHHLPWPLQDANAVIDQNTMALADGIVLPDATPLLHYARGLRVLVWWPEAMKT